MPELERQNSSATIAYYNQIRPHRGINRHTPADAFPAREKARPRGALIDTTGYRVRHDKIDKRGAVTLRHKGRLHHIGIGAASEAVLIGSDLVTMGVASAR